MAGGPGSTTGSGATEMPVSTAAGGAAAAFADVAGAGGAHFGATGEAERGVGAGALLSLDQFGGGVGGGGRPGFFLGDLGGGLLDRGGGAHADHVDLAAASLGVEGGGPLLGGEDAEFGPLVVRQEVQRQPPEDVVHHRTGDPDVRVVGHAGRVEAHVHELRHVRLQRHPVLE